ncbi:MAG: class I SAM-dependent RNA methyltransferase [Hyphomonadaceae bacterium]|nr:class I SAM-dependent RNA methyltransferase [Hyphomonadaceae bacterium]
MKRITARHSPPPRPRPAAPEVRDLDIVSVGARGDGLAEPGPIYAPYTLPGERIRAKIVGDRAEMLEILAASPERQAAPCAHFGRCGGCQLQHWGEASYLAWKRQQVVEALAKRGLGGGQVEPVIPAWGEGRRRAAFHAGRVGAQVRVGFIERGGARLTPISQCPALAGPLEALALKLAPLAALVLPQRGDVTIACLWSETGADVSIKGAASGVYRSAFAALAAQAQALDLARLTIDGEPIVTRRAPLLRMGAARVTPPPGAFLQPTALGEEVLARLALEAVSGAARVVDLFSGVGTFALRAAASAEVLAVETDDAMLVALKAAADGAGGALKQVSTLRRDLLRTPFSSLEMKKFDAAIIDPPRSGARLQAEQIARAPVRKLAYVSCDPASFARDVKVLIEHGFGLTRVTPIDQFRWSPHIELVGALER